MIKNDILDFSYNFSPISGIMLKKDDPSFTEVNRHCELVNLSEKGIMGLKKDLYFGLRADLAVIYVLFLII